MTGCELPFRSLPQLNQGTYRALLGEPPTVTFAILPWIIGTLDDASFHRI
jgi:hypothetical protein